MPDINTQLRDIAIAHQHMVEQFKTTEVRKVIRLLNQMESDLKDLLAKKSGVTNWTRNRQKVLLAQVQELQKVYHAQINATVNGGLKDFGGVEATTYLAEIATIVSPYNINISLNAITPEKVWATAKRNKMMFPDGTTFTLSQMLKTFEINDITRTKQAIEQGFILGETLPEIQRKIFSTGGKFNLTKRNAETIVRTGVSHLGNTARDLTYSNNTDIVKGYQWVSTLDERTCITGEASILTKDGTKPMEDVQIGDQVLSDDGKYHRVQGKSSKIVKELVVVTLENGSVIRCTPDHYFKVTNGDFDWVEAQNLDDYLTVEESHENM